MDIWKILPSTKSTCFMNDPHCKTIPAKMYYYKPMYDKIDFLSKNWPFLLVFMFSKFCLMKTAHGSFRT